MNVELLLVLELLRKAQKTHNGIMPLNKAEALLSDIIGKNRQHVTNAHGDCISWCPACGDVCKHSDNIKECALCAVEVMNPDNPVSRDADRRAIEFLTHPPPPEMEEVKVYEAIKSDVLLDICIGGVTVRACIDCGVLIVGGPTRCVVCVKNLTEEGSKCSGKTKL